MMKCSEYCHDTYMRDVTSSDGLVQLAGDLHKREKELKELQAKRWSFAVLTLKGGDKPVIIIPVENQKMLEDNIKDCDEKLEKVTAICAVFNRLDALFEKVCLDISGLHVPTLDGLQEYAIEVKNRIYIAEKREREEIASRMASIGNKGSVNEVMNSPRIKKLQAETKKQIAELGKDERIVERYIFEVAGAMGVLQ